MAKTVYRKDVRTGGGATALDGIDGAGLLDKDECTVYESGIAYSYIVNATSGAADDGLNIIAPDTNPGTKRWILQRSSSVPAATAQSDFIVSASTPFAWIKKTLLEVKALIGLVPQTTGFTIAGGTTSKTLTVDETVAMSSKMAKTGSNLAIGSDADGDMYYRASGVLTRLAKGAANLKLFMNATAPEWASGIKVGTFTRDMSAASGNVSYTSVGFKPSLVLFFAQAGVNKAGAFSDGADNGTTHVSRRGDGSYLAGVLNWAATESIYILVGNTGDIQKAYIVSMDSDGFTLTWTKSVSPAETINCYYIAFR